MLVLQGTMGNLSAKFFRLPAWRFNFSRVTLMRKGENSTMSHRKTKTEQRSVFLRHGKMVHHKKGPLKLTGLYSNLMTSGPLIIYWLYVGLFCVMSCALFYPGSMGNDSLSQWYQVKDILPINNWHPPFLVYLWRLLNHAVEGPAALLILQSTLYWLGLGLLMDSLVVSSNKFVKLGLVASIGFFPVLLFSMASVWKDALMMSFLLFSAGLISTLFVKNIRGPKRMAIVIFALMSLIFAATMRHNAVFAVMPLTCAFLWMLFEGFTKRLRIAYAITGLFLVIGASVLVNKVGVEKPYPYLVNQLVVWNLAGISIEENQLLIPKEAFVDPDSASLDVLRRHYSEASNNSLVFNSGILSSSLWEDADFGHKFLADGSAQIMAHFQTYLQIRIRFLKHFFGIGRWRPYMAYIIETKYWAGDEKLGLKMYGMNNQKLLNLSESALLTRMAQYGFYNAIPYLIGLLVLLLLLLWKLIQSRLEPTEYLLLILGSSGMAYWLPYLVLAPSNDFRYHLWTIISFLIGFVVLVSNHLFNRFSRTKTQQ